MLVNFYTDSTNVYTVSNLRPKPTRIATNTSCQWTKVGELLRMVVFPKTQFLNSVLVYGEISVDH